MSIRHFLLVLSYFVQFMNLQEKARDSKTMINETIMNTAWELIRDQGYLDTLPPFHFNF